MFGLNEIETNEQARKNLLNALTQRAARLSEDVVVTERPMNVSGSYDLARNLAGVAGITSAQNPTWRRNDEGDVTFSFDAVAVREAVAERRDSLTGGAKRSVTVFLNKIDEAIEARRQALESVAQSEALGILMNRAYHRGQQAGLDSLVYDYNSVVRSLNVLKDNGEVMAQTHNGVDVRVADTRIGSVFVKPYIDEDGVHAVWEAQVEGDNDFSNPLSSLHPLCQRYAEGFNGLLGSFDSADEAVFEIRQALVLAGRSALRAIEAEINDLLNKIFEQFGISVAVEVRQPAVAGV
jgi:hypothetical protein